MVKILLLPYLCIHIIFGISGLIHQNSTSNNSVRSTDIAANQPVNQTQSITIGLMVEKDDSLGDMARKGAELAILEANEGGGYKNRLFELVVNHCEGPWGVTSKRIVSMIYEDDIRVVMGSLDGRNGHLAEQVTTKSHVAYVTIRATDPTLSQAFVPWFFRCIHDDIQQAGILVHEIYEKRKMSNIAILVTDDYDAKTAVDYLLKITKANDFQSPKLFTINTLKNEYQEAINKAVNSGCESLGLFCEPASFEKYLQLIRNQNKEIKIFTNIKSQHITYSQNLEGLILVSPGQWYGNNGYNFKQNFQTRFSQQAELAAGYAYDGMKIIINAIQKAGLDREAIRDQLAETAFTQGVTGPIRFDETGNLVGLPDMIEIKNGETVLLTKSE